MTWIAPDVERSEDYPARRNEPEREMLRDWLDWHRATLLRKCAGLDAARLAQRAVPPSSLSLLGLVRHMSDTERGWVRQFRRGEQVPDLYYRRCPGHGLRSGGPGRRRGGLRAVPRPSAGPSMPRWRARTWTHTFTFSERGRLSAVDVAAPRGGVRAPQRSRRPAPRGDRRLDRRLSLAAARAPVAAVPCTPAP